MVIGFWVVIRMHVHLHTLNVCIRVYMLIGTHKDQIHMNIFWKTSSIYTYIASYSSCKSATDQSCIARQDKGHSNAINAKWSLMNNHLRRRLNIFVFKSTMRSAGEATGILTASFLVFLPCFLAVFLVLLHCFLAVFLVFVVFLQFSRCLIIGLSTFLFICLLIYLFSYLSVVF